jgi:hypothetical protein
MKKFYILLLAGSLSLVQGQLAAQTTAPKTITATYQKTPVATVLADLEKKFQVRIFFRPEWLQKKTVNVNVTKATLPEALQAALAETEYVFTQYDAANYVLLPVAETLPGNQGGKAEQPLANQFDAKAQVIGGVRMAPRGQKLTLRGSIKDGKRNEAVIGARISVESLGIGTVTDVEGNYQLSLEAGKYEITYSAIGLETKKKTVQLNGSGTLDLELLEKAVALNEVRIEAVRQDANVSGNQMGVSKLRISEIKKMPALLGEVDVVKSVQMLPGVTTVGEAAAGFNVRGGNTDQNLILLDEVPVFNPMHLFGFFSVFNPDAVQDVTLYRGAIPAQLGGRLSAVLDVKQKEGNLKKFQGTGGIGAVTGRLALEGPVMNKKGSFLVAGRSSYSSWIFKTLPNAELRDDNASFYDGTVKFSGLISEKNKLIFSLYRSHDSFQFNADTAYSWNTTNGSVTFNHIYSEKLQVNVVGFFGHYGLNLDYKKPLTEAQYSSGIDQKGLKADFAYRGLKQTIRFGGSSTYYNFAPGSLKPNAGQSTVVPRILPEDKAVESALYVNDDLDLTHRLALSVGMRFSLYQNLGPGQVYQYEEGKPKSLLTLTDTVYYGENSVVKPYQGLEPRASIRFSLNEKNSLKAGYSRTRQYLHVVSNTLTVSPVDIWKASNQYIKPQIGDQVSLGFFRNMQQNTVETSVEVYYKTIKNQLDYKDGAKLFLNEALETDLLAANGKAYGIEFMVNKKTGRVTGWASYAFSRTFLQTEGVFPEEQVNKNQQYAASYDKPHNLNLALNYQINRRFSISGNFNFSSGRPFTAAVSHYVIDGNVVPYYGPRNAYRLPAYHRLDLSVTMLTNHKKNKKWEGSWNFGIYNVYTHENVYSAFYRHTYGSRPRAYRLAVIGTAIPSVTYNFKF